VEEGGVGWGWDVGGPVVSHCNNKVVRNREGGEGERDGEGVWCVPE